MTRDSSISPTLPAFFFYLLAQTLFCPINDPIKMSWRQLQTRAYLCFIQLSKVEQTQNLTVSWRLQHLQQHFHCLPGLFLLDQIVGRNLLTDLAIDAVKVRAGFLPISAAQLVNEQIHRNLANIARQRIWIVHWLLAQLLNSNAKGFLTQIIGDGWLMATESQQGQHRLKVLIQQCFFGIWIAVTDACNDVSGLAVIMNLLWQLLSLLPCQDEIGSSLVNKSIMCVNIHTVMPSADTSAYHRTLQHSTIIMQAKQQRQAIAVEAARIIVQEGQRNYGAAKRKAAERLGTASARHLPSNHEIEQELRTYQTLFVDGQDEQVDMLQHVALEIMQHFAELRPRIAGPVLEGTADQFSSITLHVFSDNPDDMVRLLMDLKIPYVASERRLRWYDQKYRSIQVLNIDWRGHACELCLFASNDLRQPPPSPVDGQPQRRASITQLRALMAAC